MIKLTRQQEYVARWLRRAGSISLREANERGVEQKTLDLLVQAGLAEKTEGDSPIYKTLSAPAFRTNPTPTAGPARPAAPTPINDRVLALLKDGQPRTAGEVASALCQSLSNFTAMREVARDVQRALPLLTSQGFLYRTFLGEPVGPHAPGRYTYEEKYVDVQSVLPVCQICFRQHWGVAAAPPQSSGHPIELCTICRRRTNDPSYLPKDEVLGQTT